MNGWLYRPVFCIVIPASERESPCVFFAALRPVILSNAKNPEKLEEIMIINGVFELPSGLVVLLA